MRRDRLGVDLEHKALDVLLPIYRGFHLGCHLEETFFLNGRKGRAEAEFLCYSSGRILRADLESDRRELLSHVLGVAVSSESMSQWAAASLTDWGVSPGPMQISWPVLSQ